MVHRSSAAETIAPVGLETSRVTVETFLASEELRQYADSHD